MSKVSKYPQCYNNQLILQDLAKEIPEKFGHDSRYVIKSQNEGIISKIINKVFGWLPSSQNLGSAIGENLGWSYGAHLSNGVIDVVVKQFFPTPQSNVPTWSFQNIKKYFFGAVEVTAAEAAKITITPKALPYISLFAAAAGGAALPLVIDVISKVYHDVMFDPREKKQFSKLTIGQLFTEDPETGRLRDAYGRLLSAEDMKDIFQGTAQYDLIYKLYEAMIEINKIYDMSFEEICQLENISIEDLMNQPKADFSSMDNDLRAKKAKKTLKELVKPFMTTVVDNGQKHVVFADGRVRTDEEKMIMKKGIIDLARINPMNVKENIRSFVEMIADHAILPIDTIQANGDNLLNQPLRMPSVFTKVEDSWKNAIIKTDSGLFVVIRDVLDPKTNAVIKEKGTVVSQDNMKTIIEEMSKIQIQNKAERMDAIKARLANPKMINKNLFQDMAHIHTDELNEILTSIIPNASAEHLIQFKKDLFFLPSKNQMKERAKKIGAFVNNVNKVKKPKTD